MNRKRSNLSSSVSVGLAFVLAVAAMPVRGADEEPNGVQKFKSTLEKHGKLILKIAHPLGKYNEVKFDSYQKVDQGHELTYTILWTGKENMKVTDFATMFAFQFKLTAADKLEALQITVLKDTSPTKAWKASNLALGPIRVPLKNSLQLVVDDQDLLKQVDGTTKAEGLLAIWLTHEDRKLKKK
jgi:hypothetical protein